MAGRAHNDVWALVLVFQLLPLLPDGQAAKEVAHPPVLHERGKPGALGTIPQWLILTPLPAASLHLCFFHLNLYSNSVLRLSHLLPGNA